MSPLIFVFSIVIGYSVPYICGAEQWASWACVDVVYMVDMSVSRSRWPEEMNGPEISTSEAMSYAGIASASIMPLLPIPEPFDFLAYLLIGSLTYLVWSSMSNS